MTTAAVTSASTRIPPPRRFNNAAELLRALGNIPPERVVLDPLPGTATEADLLRLVERENRPCELVEGTLVEKTVGIWESRIALILATRLETYASATGAGAVFPGDATLRMASSGRIRLPDVSFISTARLPKTAEPVPVIAPDLVVEVLSEGNTADEMGQKLKEYFGSGTRLAWYIDPRTRTVAIYHAPGEPTRVLQESESLDGETVVPGFTMPVADLFRNVPRS